MTAHVIQEPQNTSPVPDSDTKKGMGDHTGYGSSAGRVLHVNFVFFKYGTDDKAHAASMVLTAMITLFLVGMLIFGHNDDQTKDIVGWLKTAFLLTTGVAIGQGTSSSPR